SYREHQSGMQVAKLPLAQLKNFSRIGRAFMAAIPTVVLVGTVAVVLAIFFIVLVLVANEVAQSKAIMGGDEIDAVIRFSVFAVEVLGAGHRFGKIARLGISSFDEATNDVPVLAVPFSP